MTQILTCRANGTWCGIEIAALRHVVKTPPLSPLPVQDSRILGSFVLRGQLVTALCLPFAPQPRAYSVIVEDRHTLYAIAVDRVETLLQLDEFTPARDHTGIAQLFNHPERGVLAVIDLPQLLLKELA